MKALAFTVFLVLTSTIGFTQQSRVDSVITLLNKCKTAKGLDTLTLYKAWSILGKTSLNDAQINQIESESAKFNEGNDEDIWYMTKFFILISLSKSDKNKAIDYGRLNILKLEKSKTPHADFLQLNFSRQLRLPYRNSNRLPEGFKYYTERLNAYKKLNDSTNIASCYFVLGTFYSTIGLMVPATYHIKKAMSYSDSTKRVPQYLFREEVNPKRRLWIRSHGTLGEFYLNGGNYQESIKYSSRLISLLKPENDPFPLKNLAKAYLLANQLDSVSYFLNLAKKASIQLNPPNYLQLADILQTESLYNIKISRLREADSLLQQCKKLIKEQNLDVVSAQGIIAPDYYLALVRINQNRYKDAITLLNKDIIRLKNLRLEVLRDYKLLAEMYEKTGENRKAKETYKSFISLQDSLLADQAKFRNISFEFEQQMNENELSISKLQNKNKISALTRNFSFAITALLSILAIGLYFRFRANQKSNAVLQEKNEEIQSTLSKLKSTQAQLIQSEKLASLGELTAGIAHEIQNPLNFVNNFSELSVELIKEIQDERQKTREERDEALEDELLSDLRQNQSKINLHGKRASSIVSGMLEHSRTSTGERTLTDINKLADEYLRLSYHGIRAKDNAFNSDYKTEFDENLPKIEVIPQDMGRVLLNLINNAFWAVKTVEKPLVTVKTEQTDNQLIIKVTDNGTGMTGEVKAKIFQPFFTTKPTGQGTGLGLSLAYDIVTKGHGGTIEVESIQNIGSAFVITIPIQTVS